MNTGTAPRIIGIGDLFRESFRTYRERFGVFEAIMIVPVALSLGGALMQAQVPAPDDPRFLQLFLPTLALILIGGLSYLFAYIALVAGARGDDAGTAYRVSFPRFFPYLWIAIITNLILAGGLVMGILPGFIFSIWFSFAPLILIDTNSRGMDALLKSKEYVRGLWWPIFGRLLFGGILIAFFNMAFVGIGGIFKENDIASALLPAIVQFLALPFAVAFAWTLYQSVKAAKPEITAPQKRGFFIFSAVLGILAPLLIIAAVAVGFLTRLVPASPGENPYLESPADTG